MATLKGIIASGSVDGKMINLPSTATNAAPITLHTAVTGTGENNFDEITIYAGNNGDVDDQVVIGIGGVATANLIKQTIAAGTGLYIILPGIRLNNGTVVYAYSSGLTGNVNVFVEVNRVVA